MSSFAPISGIIVSIESFPTSTNDLPNCTLLIGLRSSNQELTYFIVDQNTYIVDYVTLKRGDRITAYYDTSLPVPLIYPPQYRAVVIAKYDNRYFIKVDTFNDELISSDGQLKLNISSRTQLLLPNNQSYLGEPTNKTLIVFYGSSTKSIPAITTPYRVVVLCSSF